MQGGHLRQRKVAKFFAVQLGEKSSPRSMSCFITRGSLAMDLKYANVLTSRYGHGVFALKKSTEPCTIE